MLESLEKKNLGKMLNTQRFLSNSRITSLSHLVSFSLISSTEHIDLRAKIFFNILAGYTESLMTRVRLH
jgi:hypothetical protein